jgi:hypothetical protein
LRITNADRVTIVVAGVLFAVAAYYAPNLADVVIYLVVLLVVFALVLLNARRRKDVVKGATETPQA